MIGRRAVNGLYTRSPCLEASERYVYREDKAIELLKKILIAIDVESTIKRTTQHFVNNEKRKED
jgi:hypothetical protein